MEGARLIDFYRRINDQVREARQGETLCDLVAASVTRSPDAVALIDGEVRWSYRQLAEEAGRIQNALRRSGVGPEARVAVYLRRRAPLIAALLGVQRAGGAYVPLDPAYPSERTFTILEDAAPSVVLTEEALLSSLPPLACPILTLEKLDGEAIADGISYAEADALAYLIYTSGSTGKPKGVAIPHRCAVNLIRWAADFYAPDDLRGMLVGTSINFDLSVWEIFLPLTIGGTLILAENALALPELPAKNAVTFVNTVPSAIAELVRQGPLPESVRVVALAGEALRRELVDRVFARNPGVSIYNFYAPSETTTYSTYIGVEPGEAEPTIGVPLANTRVFVLGENFELLPPGELGELYLGGAGITRGYLYRPALTAAAFVPDPFAEMPGFAAGDRLYRTGDLVKLREDGQLEFFGRRDHQVKIRGFRVELGEIEKTLEKNPAISRAAVLGRKNEQGELELVAILEAADDGVTTSELLPPLREELAARLPSYMVPGRFELLAALPLLPNGKIDRKTLLGRPLPPRQEGRGGVREEPREGTETILAALFREVLGVKTVARQDSFVALGGHSLLATRLAGRFRAAGGQLEAKHLLLAESLAELAELEDRLAARRGHLVAASAQPVATGRPQEPRLLSPAQERLYFFYRLAPASSFYNEAAAVGLAGPLDREALRQALELLAHRQEALRTTFAEVGGAPRQAVNPPSRFELAEEEATAEQVDSRLRALAAEPFDLAVSPWRCRLLRLGPQRQVLWLGFHHLIYDGISLEIFEAELAALYSALAAGEPPPRLPELPYSFADFAEWQRQRLQGENLAELIAFWRRRLGDREMPDLPFDRPRPEAPSFDGAYFELYLPAAEVKPLEELGRSLGATPFLTFLTPFMALLAGLTGSAAVRVGTPAAGRDTPGSENLLGYFVNTLVLGASFDRETDFAGLLAALRGELAAAIGHQEVPLEHLVAQAGGREGGRNPLFQVLFQLFEGQTEVPPFRGLEVARRRVASTAAKVDLELQLSRRADGGLEIGVIYATELLSRDTVERWLELYQSLLREILSRPERPFADLEMLGLRFEPGAGTPPARRPAAARLKGPPRTATEAQVAAAFSEVLGLTGRLDGLGIEADFFALGGHSLLATRLIAVIAQSCGVELPVRSLFAAPTVAAFAATVDAARAIPASFREDEPPPRPAALLPEADRALYAAINATRTDFPRDSHLVERLLASFAAWPEQIAAEYRGRTFTYRQLDESSRRLAWQLQEAGVRPGTMVGVCLERGLDLIVALVGVVRAGAAYVPLDADYPSERLAAMVIDTAMPLILAGDAQAARLAELGRPILLFSRLAAAATTAGRAAEPVPDVAIFPESAAYVIFTSGSTGRPKGVVIPHRGVLRLVLGTTLFKIAPGEVVAQISTASFDAYTLELWGALLHGGRLLVIDRDTQLDPAAFCAAIDREIALLPLNAAFFAQLAASHPRAFRKARYLFFGGEASDPGTVRRVLEWKPRHLKNTYGPTECTMLATAYEVPERAEDLQSLPIGRPISNTEVLILDRAADLPAPIGVAGELCIGGDGLAWGYLARPAATAAAFVPHPSSAEPGARLYRSGDLARLLPSGDIEYLGRIDLQVKVRGFRIELPEIEAVLGRHPAVSQAVALARGQGAEAMLLAFVVAAGDQNGEAPASAAELKAFCAEHLPSWSVPLVQLIDKMPLTPTGKIDRRALASLELAPEEDAPEEAEPPGLEGLVAKAFGELLGRKNLQKSDDFFTLGGHSLLAIRLIARVRELCGVELPVRSLFLASTVEAFAAAVAAALAEADAQPGAPVDALAAPANETPSRVLSFSQERLLFLHRFDPASPAYNIPFALALHGPLDRVALNRALAAIEDHQEVLRTRFREVRGQAFPEVLPAFELALPEEKISRADLPERLRALGQESFDLFGEKPWRLRLFELESDDEHVLFVNVHHIAFDGLSALLFEQDLAAFYRAAAAGEEVAPAPLPWTYADYAAWQKAWAEGPELAEQLKFWRARLPTDNLELPTDYPRPPVATFRGAAIEERLDAALVARLEELGRRQGATPFLTFLAPFLMLLSRLASQKKVSVGVPFSGRHRGEVAQLYGFFINTLVLSADFADDPSFETLLARLRRDFTRIYSHQEVPFEKLVEDLRLPRDPSRNPLFQSAFQLFERDSAALDFGGLEVEKVPIELQMAKLDFEIGLERVGGEMLVAAYYAVDLFEAATARRWLELYLLLLRQIAAEPAARLSAIELLRPADRALYAAINATATDFPRDSNLIAAFAARAAAGPELIAVEYRGREMSYGELDLRSARLAGRLRELGVLPGSMVGVCLERGFDLVVAILAIIRAGAAYVPLDADYPADRLAAMAEDTAMPLLLAGEEQAAKLPPIGARIVPLARLASEAKGPLAAETRPPAFPESPAYVIFTSGSTGRPKGVVIPHRGVLRLVAGTRLFELAPGEVVAQISTASFDAFTIEMWGALLNGGRLLVIDRDTQLDAAAFTAAIDREIALLPLNAAFFAQLVVSHPGAFRRARYLFFGGEASEPGIVRRAIEQKPKHLKNTYGPTECTMLATAFEVPDRPEDFKTLSIGKPISNTDALIVERCGRIAPIGVVGELGLGGAGLATGYLGRPAQTAAAFVPHPKSAEPGARLYRTGDLARLLPSGDIEYLGRIDFQVKVRGFRIELGEIEAVLGRHPAVREKVALTRGQGADQLLLAFVVPATSEAGEALTTAARLKAHCAEHLPAYSVPLVKLIPAMPMTPTGKIDRKALAASPLLLAESAAGTPPRSELERQVAAVFGELLGLDELGLEADFFALGGHSLLAIRALAKIRERCGVEMPVRSLFLASNVEGFAAAIAARGEEGAPGPAPAFSPAGAEPVLSFAQQRLYFLHRFDPLSASYNIPFAFALRGHLDRAALYQALARLEERQEVLRTRFRDFDGLGYPELLPAGDVEVRVEKATWGKVPQRLRELAEEPFDLLREKPWRVILLELGENDNVLFVNVHHIAFDGLSAVVFERELAALYRAAAAGGEARLPALPWSYPTYAAWQKSWLEGAELERQLAFWRQHLRGDNLDLPTDHPRPKVANFEGGILERRLEATLVEKLEALGRGHGATPFLTFLGPFLMLLSRLSGQRQVRVGVPFSGRHRGEVENLCGFFINTLVLAADFGDDPSLPSLLPRLREDFGHIVDHQDVPFEKLVEALEVERDPSRNPLFQVAYQLFEAGGQILDLGDKLKTERLPIELRMAKLDLELSLDRAPSGDLLASLAYAVDLFEEATAERFFDFYELILRQIAAAPDRRLSEISLLRPADGQLYAAINATTSPYAYPANLQAALAAQVAASGDRVAVEFRGAELSYRQLDEESNRLARCLLSHGVRPGAMVGVCIERGPELVLTLLAIIKAGAAYVPLDADYPAERLAAMIEDTRMPLLLAGETQGGQLAGQAAEMLRFAELAQQAAGLAADPLPITTFGESAAYVIFTSGSTGRPKAVVISHRGVLELALGNSLCQIHPGEVVTQISTASFDAYTVELWTAVLGGGRLLVIDRDTQLDAAAFVAAIDREIGLMMINAAFFAQLLPEYPRAFGRVRQLIFGGEASEASSVRRAYAAKPARLKNAYGPTEVTVIATTFELPEKPEKLTSLPIGKPISNAEALVFERCGQVAPVGIAGELYLGGGLAWGYLGRPATTAAAFVPHPISRQPGARLYRSGDLARLLPSGDLEYLGRIDFQVKVRGFRIELGEIEAVLGRHPSVREKVALTRGQGADQLLLAFVVPMNDANGLPMATAAELTAFCARHLPAHAIPLIQLIEALPMTPAGKIDRRALQQRKLDAGEGELADPPQGPLEQKIAALWQELLGHPAPPSRSADFFRLGGHSLLAARLVSRLRQTLGRELPLRVVFEAPTIAGLASYLGGAAEAPAAAPAATAQLPRLPRPAGVPAPAPLSASQEQLYFLQSLDPEAPTFNMAMLWRLRGPLDAGAFELALADLLARHEILRTSFKLEGGRPLQVVHREAAPAFTRHSPASLGGTPAAAEAEALRRAQEEAATPFALDRLPLLRIHLFELGAEDNLLLLNLHHLMGDGQSFDILFADLETAYLARRRGEAPAWPELTLQFADYAAWQQSWLASPAGKARLAERCARLRADSYQLELPSLAPRRDAARRRGHNLGLVADPALSEKVRHFNPEGASLFMILLAAFAGLLSRSSGRREVFVGTPINARPHPELENQIGFYVNTAVLRIDAGGDPSFAELLARTRDALLDAFETSDLPYGRLVAELDRSGGGLFDVFFSTGRGPRSSRFADLERSPLEISHGGAQFELSFFVDETSANLEVFAEYDADLFAGETITSALRDYLSLLDNALQDPQRPLSRLLPQSSWERPAAAAATTTGSLAETPDPNDAPHKLDKKALSTDVQAQLAARLAKAKAAKTSAKT